MSTEISGFSKLSKPDKINWLVKTYFNNNQDFTKIIQQYWNQDIQLQQLHDEFIENTITNFYLPMGIAPNFLINGKNYTVPMVIEESSVVAAASKSAKYWAKRGGFKTTVLGTEKIGQVHFNFLGSTEKLMAFFQKLKPILMLETQSLTENMRKRGGGILEIKLIDKTHELENYFQLHATFETKDSMGANFINSCLEQMGKTLKNHALNEDNFNDQEKNIDVIMCILSNYVTNCVVKCEVSCKIDDLKDKNIEHPELFAQKFVQAVKIATIEPYRAVTHNKGIMNGIDAVVLATGNDFRAIEAGAHAYASKSGKYKSLSYAHIDHDIFTFGLEIPLALGTVGGLTALHPLSKLALQIMENPTANELMQIVAATGLAQNFAALRSLTTLGIQEGHMKMHINNILNQHQATPEEKIKVLAHFAQNTISHASVVDFINELRK